MRFRRASRAALALIAGLLLLSTPLFAQTQLTQTTLAQAVTTTGQSVIVVTSATGFTANTTNFFVDSELFTVMSVSGTNITAIRGAGGTRAATHLAGALVYVGPAAAFTTVDPFGSCTATAQTTLPLINVRTGYLWNCNVQSRNGITNAANGYWGGMGAVPSESIVNRTVIAPGTTFTSRFYDTVLALTTTGTFSGNSTALSPITTIVLPTVTAGVSGKRMMIIDESGGVTATTFIALNGTINGAANSATATIKTAYGSLGLMASTNGWVIVSCYRCGAN